MARTFSKDALLENGTKSHNFTNLFFCDVTLRYSIVCFLGHYLHFTFFAVKKKKTAGKDAKAGKLVAVRSRGPDGKIWNAGARAISQSDSRI